jgi:hypothetical protein
MYFGCIIQRSDFAGVRRIGNASSLHETDAFVLVAKVVNTFFTQANYNISRRSEQEFRRHIAQ